MENRNSRRSVIAAVDGSKESLAALDWAIDHALTRGLELWVITAADEPTKPTSGSPLSSFNAVATAETAARRRVWLAIRSRLVASGLHYHHIVGVGDIVHLLQRYAAKADLVVVGTRRAKATGRWLRRSSTNRLTGAISCPVASIAAPVEVSPPTDDQVHELVKT